MIYDEETKKRLDYLEDRYRDCACLSTTPFFGDRHREHFSSAHENEQGKKIPYRTFFQHDRDKILYCRSFRRLRLKTQVFPEYAEDHFRTRLDHTLEVNQIARHFARQLRLNEDLVDAIALAHDIGHTPFGHSGERALHRILRNPPKLRGEVEIPVSNGFKHNWQGLRVVDKLEKAYPETAGGLNLTNAVRLGILKHTDLECKKRDYPKETDRGKCSCDMEETLKKQKIDANDERYDIFEIQVCSLSDEIAQVVHDFEDALISNLADLGDIVKNREDWPLIKECLNKIEDHFKAGGKNGEWRKWRKLTELDLSDPENRSLLVSRIRSEMLFLLTNDVTSVAKPKLKKWECQNNCRNNNDFNQFVSQKKPFDHLISMDKLKTPFEKLQKKLVDILVHSERIARMDGKAEYILRQIFEVYINEPQQVHNSVLENFVKDKGAP
ncbi:MAG: dNTP triphosphohydrolase, partial [Nitrosopumilus sp.]